MKQQHAANENVDLPSLQQEVEQLRSAFKLLLEMYERAQNELKMIRPNEPSNTLLRLCKRAWQHCLVAVGNKRQLDAHASTALFRAIWDKNSAAVRRALASGANVNMPNAQGMMPLELALSSPQLTPIATLLIEAGADPNAKGEYDYTPLHSAVMMGDAELVKLMLERGADVHAVARWGCTVLHFAVHGSECSSTIVRMLVDAGADVNARANYGHTPLHYAIADKQEEIAALLISHGANTQAQATWLKHHRHYHGHYDTTRLMMDLEDTPKEQRWEGVTPTQLKEFTVCD